ncbi:class I SAM-dependent methyltransferase [Skermania sp. ID1734]|uniref:class I SAM-dependent methyltransferase n=1 Tax=Skermania sp. ID1734 TaxID=2597516 RepID=UPI0011812325|nr:class I SAM-dependent methyltransferase [Skermania sp. ID1734]TSD98173.1 class I SAM-dependent methyltransferase [Skermania sp. ID1734]
MSLFYSIAYRVGFTPWERGGGIAESETDRMLDKVEAEREGRTGRALDLGCGSGPYTVHLAQRGWLATGVDQVDRALERARKRAVDAGVSVDFVRADVTKLTAADVGSGFELFVDRGCFHSLTDAERADYGRCVTALAAPTADFILFSFQPGLPRPLPRGAVRADVEGAFAGWSVVESHPAPTDRMPAPLKKAKPTWYLLHRG